MRSIFRCERSVALTFKIVYTYIYIYIYYFKQKEVGEDHDSVLVKTSRKSVRCTENELKLNLKNYWSNYDFYYLLYFI